MLALLASVLYGQSRPNFVLIFADDLGYGDLSSYGAAHETSHLDRMAREGVRFTDFYVPMPFCAPSRGTILTGRYPFRTTLVNNPAPDAGKNKIGLPPSEITIAEALKPLGYATSAVGKWHLGHIDKYLPRKQGFDEYFGILYSNDMRPVQLVENETVVEYPVLQATLTKRYTERSIDFIRRNRDQPFFLYLPHAMPHKPLAASEEFYTPETPDDLYADAVRELDWSVGRILDTLRELGLDEKTFVFFTSDNGATYGGWNGGLRGMKGGNWDGGIRMPAIAWQPGTVQPGVTSSEVVASVDVFATMTTAAGAKLPANRMIDGRDLMPLLSGKTTKGPHEAVFAMGGGDLRLLRSGKWKLHVLPPRPGFRCRDGAEAAAWTDPRAPDGISILAQFEQARPDRCPGVVTGPDPKPMMLFDMEADPSEQRDVAAEHPDVVQRLKALYDEIVKDVPDEYFDEPSLPHLLHLEGGELRYDRVIRTIER